MCIFSRNVSSVSDTKIFARHSVNSGQFLVYSMAYEASSELAMILPLPTPTSPSEDAVRFINLCEYPRFFEDMSRGFPQPSMHLQAAGVPTDSVLTVYEVGSFEASFVPQQHDFVRLDDRFRLPDPVWDQLPTYRDYGFAVFKLKPDAGHVHPMAFEFHRRDAAILFFPTVHVHQGQVEPKAHFDHVLYCQSHIQHEGWISTLQPAGHFMDIELTQEIVDPEAFIQTIRFHGSHTNEDVVVNDAA